MTDAKVEAAIGSGCGIPEPIEKRVARVRAMLAEAEDRGLERAASKCDELFKYGLPDSRDLYAHAAAAIRRLKAGEGGT